MPTAATRSFSKSGTSSDFPEYLHPSWTDLVNKALFRVRRAGPLTTVQDHGRIGFARFGVTAGGPMDRITHDLGQRIVGPCAQGTAIEIDVQGLSLDCIEGSVGFVLTGGDFAVAFGQTRETGWVIGGVHAGESVEITPNWWGNWCYLAFYGVIESAKWLGSRSVNPMLVVTGRQLRAGDIIAVTAEQSPKVEPRRIPVPVFVRPRSEIRVVAGPQERFFEPGAFEVLYNKEFAVSPQYNRQGIRLEGPGLRIASALDMPSEAIVRGSVQVDGSGQASILMADHQPTGGYPKIATVISTDQDRLAQLRPRSAIRFFQSTPASAIIRLRRREQLIRNYLSALR
jgi:allophanate hydrolase